MYKKIYQATELIKGHLEEEKTVEYVPTRCNLWEHIEYVVMELVWICGHRFENVPTYFNLWLQIRSFSHIFKGVGTDTNLFPQICLCS